LIFSKEITKWLSIEDLSKSVIHAKARKTNAQLPIRQSGRNRRMHSRGLIPEAHQKAQRYGVRADGYLLIDVEHLRALRIRTCLRGENSSKEDRNEDVQAQPGFHRFCQLLLSF